MTNASGELVIVGLGELATIAFDAAGAAGERVAAFLADADRERSTAETRLGLPVTTAGEACAAANLGLRRFLVAIDDDESRRRWSRRLVELGATVVSLVHPFAAVGAGVRLGPGVLVSAGATIDPEVLLGEGTFVGGRVLICHETTIGPFCRIDPGAVIGGRCDIGEGSSIGSGAVVLSNVRIGRGAHIGPRTVVTKNVPDNASVAGIPARVTRSTVTPA